MLEAERLGSQTGAVDLRGGDGDSILLLQDLVGTDWQAIDSNEIVLGLTIRHTFLKELLDSLTIRDLNRIRKSAAVVVHKIDLHEMLQESVGNCKTLDTKRSLDGGPRVKDMASS